MRVPLRWGLGSPALTALVVVGLLPGRAGGRRTGPLQEQDEDDEDDDEEEENNDDDDDEP